MCNMSTIGLAVLGVMILLANASAEAIPVDVTHDIRYATNPPTTEKAYVQQLINDLTALGLRAFKGKIGNQDVCVITFSAADLRLGPNFSGEAKKQQLDAIRAALQRYRDLPRPQPTRVPAVPNKPAIDLVRDKGDNIAVDLMIDVPVADMPTTTKKITLQIVLSLNGDANLIDAPLGTGLAIAIASPNPPFDKSIKTDKVFGHKATSIIGHKKGKPDPNTIGSSIALGGNGFDAGPNDDGFGQKGGIGSAEIPKTDAELKGANPSQPVPLPFAMGLGGQGGDDTAARGGVQPGEGGTGEAKSENGISIARAGPGGNAPPDAGNGAQGGSAETHEASTKRKGKDAKSFGVLPAVLEATGTNPRVGSDGGTVEAVKEMAPREFPGLQAGVPDDC